jgi:hypothetical protein
MSDATQIVHTFVSGPPPDGIPYCHMSVMDCFGKVHDYVGYSYERMEANTREFIRMAGGRNGPNSTSLAVIMWVAYVSQPYPNARREGFWREGESAPQAVPTPWDGQADFLKRLTLIHHRLRPLNDWTPTFCRCCGKSLGADTFHYGRWVWPIGLHHYVAAHNVQPSPDFVAFVMSDSYLLAERL